MKEQYKWENFYQSFADILLNYRNNRGELISKLIHAFSETNIKFPKIDSVTPPVDVDPFTVFGLFNKGLTDENRRTIMKAISKEFGMDADSSVDFYGIPVLLTNMATFYVFSGDSRRNDNDIDNLWAVFEYALAFSQDESEENSQKLIGAYNKAIKQHGVRWNLTMGLYWIRPSVFINLDTRNREFLSNDENVPKELADLIGKLKNIPDGETYLKICNMCLESLKQGDYDYTSFPELSYKAWQTSTEHDSDKNEQSKASFLKWFKPVIQALRDLGGSATPAETRKRIIENEKLTKKEINETRGKNKVNKFENEVAFARSYLVKGGYIDNSVHGVWVLTQKGFSVDMTANLASDIFKQGLADLGSPKEKGALGDTDMDGVHYWLYAPGEKASMWDSFYKDNVMGLGWDELGDLNSYASKEEMAQKLREINGTDSSYKNSVHALWQFVHDLKPGDIVFAKKGRTEILGRGVVESDYEYDENDSGDYPNKRKTHWTHSGSWQSDEMFAMKTLTDITNYTESREKIESFFITDDEEEDERKVTDYSTYTSEDFFKDVYMEEDKYKNITDVLEYKKNIILQGAPGVGKTYMAKRLAYSIMGVDDSNRVMMVQFHQSYSYEDFIMGLRPTEKGYEIKKGSFYTFCKEAEEDSDNKYFFIIDEINRGNLSKIFGELFMLIENDKRGPKNKIRLVYSNELFYVPENIYIIGLMNTADRSLAILDYALRRRFAFFEILPVFDNQRFIDYRLSLNNSKFNSLIQCIELLNEEIKDDDTLGKGFCIGHSYFCNYKENTLTDDRLKEIVNYEIIPMLQEYWFDEQKKVTEWAERLRSSIK